MRVLPLLFLGWIAAVAAQDAAPAAAETNASVLHARADALRKDADARFAAENKSCWDKFLVQKCLDEAKKAKNEALAESRRIEQQARALEREKRHRDFEEREARRLADEPKHEADAAAQAERNRKAQQEAVDRVERKRLEAEQREAR